MRPPVRLDREHDFGVMTPMIDVVFLLLVFFVIGAAGQVPEALLPTELAAAGSIVSETPPAPPPLTVEVWLKLSYDAERNNTVIDMNGTKYDDVAELKVQLKALAELAPENPIVLDIGPDVPMGDVIDVYDTCQASGFLSVDFALDQGAAR